MSRYVVPNHFNHNYIDEFLQRFGGVFPLKERAISDVILEASTVSQINSVGVLLLYKFMEYTTRHRCFLSPQWFPNKVVNEAIEKYGFSELMSGLVAGKDRKSEDKALRKIGIKVKNDLIIAPQPLVRGGVYTENALRDVYFPKILDYYKYDNVSEIIATCVTEVLFNFYKHATNDEQSILVAEGNKHKIEIACADTGNGIVRTLKGSVGQFGNMSPELILQQAVKKGVTSKLGTNHMGRGLWLLDRAATLTGGKLFIYSQGGGYKNEAGKTRVSKCGFWGGTVIYLNLPLRNPVTIENVLSDEIDDINQINLNII